MNNTAVEIEHVSMKYRVASEKLITLKEYVVAAAKRQLKYRDFWVFKDVNLSIEKGDIIGIIGRNGAGKSTLLKIIAGVLEPTEGRVRVNGNIVPMLELGSGFDFDLTGRENVFLNGAILGYSEEFLKEKYDEIVEFSELGSFINNSIRSYSSGMIMRLAFSIATVVNPEILIVDEILAVGDETFQQKSKRRMLSLMSGGTTVLFVSHSLAQVSELCNKAAWLEDGKLRMFGDTKTVCDAYHESNNIDTVKNKDEVRLYENHMDKSARDVLYIYGLRKHNYYWRVGVGKEQLLSCCITSGEIWYENITDNLADQFSVFIFEECPKRRELEDFIRLIKKRNKKVIFEMTEIDDVQSDLYESCSEYIDAIILPDESLKSKFCNNSCILYLPYVANDRLAQVGEREKYERDTMPGMNLEDFDSEEMKLRYKQACVRMRERKKNGYRILCVTNKSDFRISEYEKKISQQDMQNHPDHNWDMISAYDEYGNEYDKLPVLVAAYDLIVFPHPKGMFSGAEERFRVTAGLVGTSVGYINDKEGVYTVEPEQSTDDIRGNLAINYGYRFGSFIKKMCVKRYAFLIDLDNRSVPDSISDSVAQLYEKGYDVVILDCGNHGKSSLFNHMVPIISAKQKDILIHYDAMIAIGWEGFDYLKKYSDAKGKFCYIDRCEIEEYAPGDNRRFAISQSIFNPDPVIQLISDNKELMDQFDKLYGITILGFDSIPDF